MTTGSLSISDLGDASSVATLDLRFSIVFQLCCSESDEGAVFCSCIRARSVPGFLSLYLSFDDSISNCVTLEQEGEKKLCLEGLISILFSLISMLLLFMLVLYYFYFSNVLN